MDSSDDYSDMSMSGEKPEAGTAGKIGKGDAYAKYMAMKKTGNPDAEDDDSDEDISITEDEEEEPPKKDPEPAKSEEYSMDMDDQDFLASGSQDKIEFENVEVKDPE